MSEDTRVYDILGRIEGKVESNHTDVIQRLTALETLRHTPDTCPGLVRLHAALNNHNPDNCAGNIRTEKKIDKHLEEHKEEKRTVGWKNFIKEMVKLILAGLTGGAITSQIK